MYKKSISERCFSSSIYCAWPPRSGSRGSRDHGPGSLYVLVHECMSRAAGDMSALGLRRSCMYHPHSS